MVQLKTLDETKTGAISQDQLDKIGELNSSGVKLEEEARKRYGDAGVTQLQERLKATNSSKINNPTNLNVTDYNKNAEIEGKSNPEDAYNKEVLDMGNNTPPAKPDINLDTNTNKDLNTPVTGDEKTDFNVDAFKKGGSQLSELENVIESKYNTVATNENGKIVANINGVDYEWNIDEAGNPIKKKLGGESEQDIFSRMVNGEQFDNTGIKTTQEYKKASQRKMDFDKFSNMSESDLSYQLQEGLLLPGTAAYNDLKQSNPVLVQNAENLKSLNSVNSALNGKEEEPKTIQEKISDYLLGITSDEDVADYKTSLANDKETVDLNSKITAKDLEITELVDMIDNIEEDIEKDLDGATISRARKTVLATERSQELARAYKLKLAERDVLAGQLQTRATDIKYDIEQAQYKKQEELQNFNTMYQVYQDSLATQEVTKWEKLNDNTLYNASTGETMEIGQIAVDGGKWAKFDEETLYNNTTGQFKNITTGLTTDENGGIDYSTVDFSTNPLYTNTGEAAFANNNPTGITWGVTNELKNLWNEAGVNFSIGSPRPPEEGGNYVKFNSVQDGMDAYAIALTQRGDDVNARLQAWVGTSEGPTYAANLMAQAGIEDGAKFSELSDDQLELLMNAQLQKESPKFYNALSGLQTEQANETQYSKSAQDWGESIRKGETSLDKIQDSDLRTEVVSYMADTPKVYGENDPAVTSALTNLETMNSLVDWGEQESNWFTSIFDNDTTLESLAEDVSGGVQWSPLDSRSKEKQEYLGKIDFMLGKQTLQNLLDIKAQGGTFGALSEKELGILTKSAGVLNSLRIEDDDGKLKGFDMTERTFKDEMKKLKNSSEALYKQLTDIQEEAAKTSETDLVNKYTNGENESAKDLYDKLK